MTNNLIIQVKDDGINTVRPDQNDKALRLTVENQEQKEYAEYLRDKHGLGLRTIRTYLVGMKKYKHWKGDK